MRSIIYASIFLSASFSVANAQTPSPPAAANTAITHTVNCATSFYPVLAARQKLEGTTVVKMVIGVDGIPHDVAVDQSSGSALLDSAAVACVSTFRYRPPMQDGKPVEVVGHPTIVWKAVGITADPYDEIATRDTPNITLPKLTGRVDCMKYYSGESARAREQGDVVINMVLGADGVPRDVSIVKSSGFARLDNTALACVKEFRYTPAMRDGLHIEFRGFPMVTFRLQ